MSLIVFIEVIDPYEFLHLGHRIVSVSSFHQGVPIVWHLGCAVRAEWQRDDQLHLMAAFVFPKPDYTIKRHERSAFVLSVVPM